MLGFNFALNYVKKRLSKQLTFDLGTKYCITKCKNAHQWYKHGLNQTTKLKRLSIKIIKYHACCVSSTYVYARKG